MRLVSQAPSSVREKCREMWYVLKLSGASVGCRALEQVTVRYKHRRMCLGGVQPPLCTFHLGQIVQHVVSTPGPTKLALHLATRFLLCSLSVQRDTTMNPCSRCFSPSLYFPGEQLPVSRIEATNRRLRGSRFQQPSLSSDHVCSFSQFRHYAWVGDSLAVPQIMQGMIACCHRYVTHTCAIRSSCCDQKHVDKMMIGWTLITSLWCEAARACLTIWNGGRRGCSKSEILVPEA